jgi:hypothetical protein
MINIIIIIIIIVLIIGTHARVGPFGSYILYKTLAVFMKEYIHRG